MSSEGSGTRVPTAPDPALKGMWHLEEVRGREAVPPPPSPTPTPGGHPGGVQRPSQLSPGGVHRVPWAGQQGPPHRGYLQAAILCRASSLVRSQQRVKRTLPWGECQEALRLIQADGGRGPREGFSGQGPGGR